MSDKAIIVENLWKGYQLGSGRSGNLRDVLSGIFTNEKKEKETFWALKDLNFSIDKGDAVGIIGRNGAGKSTLLKILSRITSPTKGRFELNGRVSSLLEVGTGFHPELTGRENIFMNGTILGMTRAEVRLKFDEIVAFSGIEKFLDTPVKRYSSGMYVRLAFAVAAHLEPEILIVDEVLAVGDADFQKKCLGKMKDVSANEGRTVLFVSHNISSIKQLCQKGILLKNGALAFFGKTQDATNQYLKIRTETGIYEAPSNNNSEVFFEKIFTSNSRNEECSEFYSNERIIVNVRIKSTILIDETFKILIRIFDFENNAICSFENDLRTDTNSYRLEIIPPSFAKGFYFLSCITYKPGVAKFDSIECCNFSVIDNISEFSHLEKFDIGVVYVKHEWK